MPRIEEKLTGSNARVAQKLDRQIEVLEKDGDRASVFTQTDLRTLETMGYADLFSTFKKG